jgi:NitT/TauT family transport system ATP-binding protein/sulfonate transport system ATP-binding protein
MDTTRHSAADRLPRDEADVPREVALECDKVTKIFKPPRGTAAPVVALHETSFTVRDGEFICLLGPSGCGKSTVINMVAGFEAPTAGRITLGGHVIDGPGGDRGVVFQEESLYPWLTLRENVEFGLRLRGVSRAKRREAADHFLKLVDLSHSVNVFPDQLSGGMKQRGAIARALANEPRMLLMDEPFGALDILTRETLQDVVLRIWLDTRKTILFVTHSIEESVLLADRILVFTGRPGHLAEIVDVDLDRPRSRGHTRFVELTDRLRSTLLGDVRRMEMGLAAERAPQSP